MEGEGRLYHDHNKKQLRCSRLANAEDDSMQKNMCITLLVSTDVVTHVIHPIIYCLCRAGLVGPVVAGPIFGLLHVGGQG